MVVVGFVLLKARDTVRPFVTIGPLRAEPDGESWVDTDQGPETTGDRDRSYTQTRGVLECRLR